MNYDKSMMPGDSFDIEPQLKEEDLKGLFGDNIDPAIKRKPVITATENEFWKDYKTRNRKINWRFPAAKFLIALLVLASISWGGFFSFRQTSMGKTVSLWKLIKDGKYLVVFQNNAELRASGGFLGSFAIITLEDAKVKDIYFETNIYKRDRAFTDRVNLDPPQPVKQFIGQGWAMRDSNNAVDFPEAAQTMEWFFKQEDGYPVDGVIAIDTTMMEDLLRLVGPIEMPEYSVTLTGDNFRSIVQYKVEKEYFESEEGKEENEPKTILKDMLPKLITKAETSDKQELASLVLAELKEKHLLFYFNNLQAQKIILEKNWGGAVKKTFAAEDYLYVNNSNFNGKKSSLNIIQDIRLNIEIGKNGEILNDLIITRIHQGTGEWPDGVNNNYIRILTPDKSQFISASLDGKDYQNGLDFFKEAGKTVFGGWVNTAPQTSHILRIKYKLPFNISEMEKYQIYLQKQPGTLEDEIEVSMDNRMLYKGKLDMDKKVISN